MCNTSMTFLFFKIPKNCLAPLPITAITFLPFGLAYIYLDIQTALCPRDPFASTMSDFCQFPLLCNVKWKWGQKMETGLCHLALPIELIPYLFSILIPACVCPVKAGIQPLMPNKATLASFHATFLLLGWKSAKLFPSALQYLS